MWKSIVNSETGSKLAEALEKTGEVISKQAEKTGDAITRGAEKATHLGRNKTTDANDGTTAAQDDLHPQPHQERATLVLQEAEQREEQRQRQEAIRKQQQELADKLKSGWGSVVEATKHAVEATRETLEKEQSRINMMMSPAHQPYKRDANLPLDVDALKDAQVVYVTDRLITMAHPAMQSQVDADITPNRKLAAVDQLLEKRHNGKFMVWNLSEIEYDTSILQDQVLTFSFPGSPSPPLGLLLKLLISMESWLKADERNVAVIHCLTGKGRTSTVLAAFLCWIGEAGFGDKEDVNAALEYIAKCKHVGSAEDLTIPSQRRYASYFTNMLDGVRPSQPPLMLKRIIMSEAPKFAKGPPRPDQVVPDNVDPQEALMGCAPYLQLFKAGQLVFTTAASIHYHQKEDDLPFCAVSDGQISFHIEHIVQGDILVRCRHLTAAGQRVSMFRAAFHTGYVPPNVMRLTKAQLDGACSDKRFSDDFFLDLIFEPCDAEMASKHLTEDSNKGDATKEDKDDEKQDDETQQPQGEQDRTPQKATVTASAYDSMLDRDSRFWDVIAERRQQHATASHEEETEKDPLWGPTIGRRRNFNKVKTTTTTDGTKQPAAAHNSLHAFSIGGEFDFIEPQKEAPVPVVNEPKPTIVELPKERDELMEALMAVENEAVSPPAAKKTQQIAATEEITFGEETKEPAFKETKETPPAPSSEVSTEQEPKKEAVQEEEDKSEKNTTDETAVAEAAALLNDVDLDLDTDVDAFLASSGVDASGAGLDDLDFDDAELEDLESFLSSK